MRVTLINQYYPPDTSATAKVFEELVSELASSGHRVRVLCGRPSYNPTGRRAWRLLRRTAVNGVVIERVGSSGVARERMWGRVANYLTFALIAGVRVLFLPRPDVLVVGSDPPFSIWLALLAARGRPVVYSLQDLHPDFAIASGMIREGAITRIWDASHRAGLKRASLVVCLGETMAERVAAKGIGRENVAVVPHGASLPQSRPDSDVVAGLRGESRFLCLHAGNLGGAGAWETLIGASKLLESGAELIFIGDGFNSDMIRGAGLRLLPFRPPEELASVMAAGDMQVVTQRQGMEGLVVPSKLYTIIAHGRPVLAVVPAVSEVARIVEEWGCGLVADPEDPYDVASKIEWAQANPEALARMGEQALLAAERYERGALLKEFVAMTENVVVA